MHLVFSQFYSSLYAQERTPDEHQHLVQGIVKRNDKRRKRIKAAGIDYECPDLVNEIVFFLLVYVFV